MKLTVRGITTDEVNRLRRGGPDANGQSAVLRVAEGLANPCRHCIGLIAEGDQKLVLAYRPFDALQPYAETGPIFLHKEPCERYDSEVLPTWFDYLDPAIVRGYGEEHWIRYDTGYVVPGKGKNIFDWTKPGVLGNRALCSEPHPATRSALPI